MLENEKILNDPLPEECPTGLTAEHLGLMDWITNTQMQQLRTSEARLRTILETCGAAIAFADYRGRFSYVNGMFKSMFGYSDDEVLGKHISDLIVVDPAIKVSELEKANPTLNGREDQYRMTYPFKTQGGRVVWGDVHVSILRGASPIDLQTIFVIVDITAQQLLVEQLHHAKNIAEEANRAKSQFLATMSHEIRTPLNGVIGVSDLLMETTLQPKQLEYAQLIKTSGESLLFLINDILDFSKIEAGKLELEETEFNLYELVESVLRILAPKADEGNLELVTTFDRYVPGPMFGDPGRLRQILVNLAGNALKFTKKGGARIHVSLDDIYDTHLRLKFSVRDTGIGIPKERQDRLFQPFSQVDASSTRLYGGTGLGLAICKRLVEMMGGGIHVESDEGKGSEFWFTAKFRCLPPVIHCLRADEYPCVTEKCEYSRGISPECCARSGREVAYLQRVAELHGFRTLVVGRGEIRIPAVIEQLGSWGMAVEQADDAEQAFQRLTEADTDGRPFRLVLIDFVMNDRTSDELVRKIQAHPRLHDTAIICFSPLSVDLLKQDWSNPKNIRCVTKPVGGSILLGAVVQSFFVLPDLVFNCHPEPDDSPQTSVINVLVVEDNPVNRIVVAEILNRAGMKSTLVENGLEAIEILRKIPFDIVLMDCQMPVMDGYEATTEIRKWEKNFARPRRLPIIALTANATSGDEEKCLAAGMDDYCSKPVDKDKLLASIHRWVEQTNPAVMNV